MTFRHGAVSLAAVALLATSGCSGGAEPKASTQSADGAPLVSPSEASPTPPSWSIEDARTDRIPQDPPAVDSGLPVSFPADDSVLPDLLADPPGRARLAYHPRESFEDGEGWLSERVFFLGVDDSWRSLEMVDLGLPDDLHTGWDTYGAGELSPDGTRWAAKTRTGLVLLDLHSGRARDVRLAGEHTSYMDWHPSGDRIDVVRSNGRTSRTWSVDTRSLARERAGYRLPLDGVAPDGSITTFARQDAGTVRTVHRDGGRVSDVVPIPYRRVRFGGAVGPTRTLFPLTRGLLVVDGDSWAPQARLRLARRDAVVPPMGWLDADTVWFYEGRRGLLQWDVVSGEISVLTRVRPTARQNTYWTLSVATGLLP